MLPVKVISPGDWNTVKACMLTQSAKNHPSQTHRTIGVQHVSPEPADIEDIWITCWPQNTVNALVDKGKISQPYTICGEVMGTANVLDV